MIGDSTSLVWPTMLQDMLDAHAGKAGFYRVHGAALGESWIGAWTARAASAPRAFDAMVEDYFSPDAEQSDEPAPTIALCQVSLQGVCDARGPVKTEHDMAGAEMGADVLEELALRLRALGLERVVLTTHVYEHADEPEVGLERVALARFLERDQDFVEAGPDVWAATREYWPDAYDADGMHLNEFGIKVVAEAWYRALAGPEADEAVVQELYAKDYDVEALAREARRRDRANP